MRRYRALIEYDGTAYYGFQRQPPAYRTIQGELERVLNKFSPATITVIGAGRTDSGVHATGQVVTFDLDWKHGIEKLHRALNVNLPRDIVVLQCTECPADFHPRFDAKRRAYEYHIYNAAIRSPLRHPRSWHVVQPLDVEKMNQAAAMLIGEQDFATFGRPPQGINTVRELFMAQWRVEEPILIFSIEATAFLYRMVRSIVGCLKQVGEGRWTVEAFAAALQAGDRSAITVLAPPQGLYLAAVSY